MNTVSIDRQTPSRKVAESSDYNRFPYTVYAVALVFGVDNEDGSVSVVTVASWVFTAGGVKTVDGKAAEQRAEREYRAATGEAYQLLYAVASTSVVRCED